MQPAELQKSHINNINLIPNPLHVWNYFHWVFKLSSRNRMRLAILKRRHFNNYPKRLSVQKCRTKLLILIICLISDVINLRWSILRNVMNFISCPSPSIWPKAGNYEVHKYIDIITDQLIGLHREELNTM